MRAAALLVLVVACTHPRGDDPRRLDRDDAIVYVDGLADASLWIDGSEIGAVAELARGIALEPGPHRLELHKDGFHAHYQELVLAAAQRLRLTIELAPVLP